MMIEFDHVRMSYGDAAVITDESFTIGDGECFVLVGPSGGGKTTTLKMINRLVEPTGGTIRIDGVDIADMPLRELRLSMGYVIQSIALFPNMTVGRNVELIPEMKGWPKAERVARARELLDMVGLDADLTYHRRPDELSGGQAQRVGIVRALAARPRILLMDEPFSALDPITRAQLQELVVALHAELGLTIVFVTHDIDEACYLADRIAVIGGGRLLQIGTPAWIQAHPANEFVADLFARRHARRTDAVPDGVALPDGAAVPAGAILPAGAVSDDASDAAARTGRTPL